MESVTVFIVTVAGVLVLAGVLHLLPHLGRAGRAVSGACTHAPGLDVIVFLFQLPPWMGGAIVAGWLGLAASVAGQVVGLLIWVAIHEVAHRGDRGGPRIFKTLSRAAPAWRNHAAVWVTVAAAPLFLVVRLAEWIIYPPLIWLVDLPRYRHAEWVAVSRQKFRGLVGYDLIWCLYCDWMTGVWSLGSEMLRNVESYWCPIRFYSEKKCANCRVDFPDVEAGWVPADGTLADVATLLERKHVGVSPHAWFGHAGRTDLTVEGAPPGNTEPRL